MIYTLPEDGNTLIPFLKMWVVIPFSIVFLAMARYVQRRLGLYHLFQISTVAFLSFYLFFLCVLYPHRNDWSLFVTSFERLPHCVTLLAKHWILSLFYVLGDMWSMLFISVLFWNIAALVFTLDDAKRYYPIFSLDVGAIGIGLMGLLGLDSVEGLISSVMVVALLQMALLYAVRCRYSISGILETPQVKREPIKTVSRLPFVLFLGIAVFAYEFSDNFLDFMWKWKVSQLYPTPEAYSQYMSQVVLATGILGIFTCLFIARPLAKRVQWRTLALISPTLVLVSASGFLIAHFAQFSLETLVFLGLIMSSCMQITKYTFFDNAKELAIIGQEERDRFEAKAFADGLMTRCGKSSASFLQQILLVILMNVESSFPIYGGICILLALAAWIFATFSLTPHVKRAEYADCTSH